MSGEAPRPKRSRKSIAFQPNAGSNKTSTALAPEAPAKSSRKTRSKSLGPGGLDTLNIEEGAKEVLKNSNGNGRRASVGVLVPVARERGVLIGRIAGSDHPGQIHFKAHTSCITSKGDSSPSTPNATAWCTYQRIHAAKQHLSTTAPAAYSTNSYDTFAYRRGTTTQSGNPSTTCCKTTITRKPSRFFCAGSYFAHLGCGRLLSWGW
jgi:hypothetical protein